jgi:hypothetical protein
LYCTWVWTSVAWNFFPVWISHFILIHYFLHSFIHPFFLSLSIITHHPKKPHHPHWTNFSFPSKTEL